LWKCGKESVSDDEFKNVASEEAKVLQDQNDLASKAEETDVRIVISRI